MFAHVSGQDTPNQYSFGSFSHIRILDDTDYVEFGIVSENSEKCWNVHVFQDTLVVVLLRPLSIQLDLVQIVGALMVQIMRDGCQQTAE